MTWVLFAYSLPSDANSARVTLWRRLRRLGAISPTGSLYILPAGERTTEAFQWLAQEIEQAGGEALVIEAPRFIGLENARLVARFHAAQEETYAELATQLATLESQLAAAGEDAASGAASDALEKLQRQFAEIAQIDYFDSPAGAALAGRLAAVRRRLAGPAPAVAPAAIDDYCGRCWVTRPRPHVDRLACVWLIRRFVDPAAVVRYDGAPAGDDIAFDMVGASFGHQGNLCTFEVLLRAFGLADGALRALAEIVHEIDLRDGRFHHPETAGVDAALRGWLLADLPDETLESQGLALFDGLYAALRGAAPETT